MSTQIESVQRYVVCNSSISVYVLNHLYHVISDVLAALLYVKGCGSSSSSILRLSLKHTSRNSMESPTLA